MRVERVRRVAGTPLAATVPDQLPSTVAQLIEVTQSVLVLGSRQGVELVDLAAARAAGVEVLRRHSGGGAVLLHPQRSLWLDVLVPRADPLWSDDVSVAFHWLGAVWVDALAHLGVVASMHRDPLERTAWGSLVCFGALGPGEVAVDGRKVVGMSQRRTRAGARFQCLVHDAWEPGLLLDLLILSPAERADAMDDLAGRAAGPGVALGDVERSVLDRLGIALGEGKRQGRRRTTPA